MLSVSPEATPRRLLVVDDDEVIRNLMQAIFRRHHVVVECAGDGDAALRCLRHARYDAVILDLLVPGPNGFEIVRELKSRDRALLGRTIVLTAAGGATLRDFADGQLVRRVMHKPFDLDEFVGEVRSLTAAAPAEHVH